MKAVRAMNQAIPNISTQNICLVTVTYEDRFDLLQRVIEAASKNGVSRTFVVSNNAESSSIEQLRTLEAKSNGSINVIYLSENMGLVGGYKVGLENAANCPDCDFIWLLDDHNQPREHALEQLLKYYQELSKTFLPEQLSLLSLREDREHLKKATKIANAYQLFPRTSSFLDFHVLDLPRKFMQAYVDRYVWLKNYVNYTSNKLNFLVILSFFAYIFTKN